MTEFVVGRRTACSVSLGLLVVALLGCSSSSDTTNVQGAYDWEELVGTTLHSSPIRNFQARDGSTLFYRSYGEQSPIDLILVHGSAADSAYLSSLATWISGSGIARVWTPDVRGHGSSPGRRGDIDYIDQLEDDLADLSSLICSANPRGALVIGGHSSGGGLAIRLAGGSYGNIADGYLLLAPFLQHDAPTVRPDAGGWAMPKTGRIIGLNFLNAMGIQSLNDLTALEFNLPPAYRTGDETLSYSYRLMMGFNPRDYASDLQALEKPTLVLVGTDDESFYADKFPVVFGAFAPQAHVELIPKATHLGLVVEAEITQLVVKWLERSVSDVDRVCVAGNEMDATPN